MFWFKKKKIYPVEIQNAEKAFKYQLDALKELRSMGHPCPDYSLKRNYEILALRYTKLALENQDKINEEIVSGLNFIIDVNRLYKENKPVPYEFFKQRIENSLKNLKNIYGTID